MSAVSSESPRCIRGPQRAGSRPYPGSGAGPPERVSRTRRQPRPRRTPTSGLISGWWTSCISATRLTPARWTAPGGTSSLTIIRSRVTWPPPRRRPRPPDLPTAPARAPSARPAPPAAPAGPAAPAPSAARPLPRAGGPAAAPAPAAAHSTSTSSRRSARAAPAAPAGSRRGSGAPARRGRPDGRQHGRQPRRADRYQRPRRSRPSCWSTTAS